MKPLIVGLTGQTGAGKTTVSRCFVSRGLPVVDCDQVARKVTERGNPCLAELAAAFGAQVLDEAGELRRREVGRMIFADPEKKKHFEDIIFPHIIDEIRAQVSLLAEKGEKAVVLDAPTLFESGVDKMCAKIISVVAPEKQRLQRIMERDNIDEELARLRVSAQHDEDFFRSHSHLTLENEDSLEALEQQAEHAVTRIRVWQREETL